MNKHEQTMNHNVMVNNRLAADKCVIELQKNICNLYRIVCPKDYHSMKQLMPKSGLARTPFEESAYFERNLECVLLPS